MAPKRNDTGHPLARPRRAAQRDWFFREKAAQAERDTAAPGSNSRGVTKKTSEAAQAFINAFHRSGVGKTQEAGRAERLAGSDGNVLAFEQLLSGGSRVGHFWIEVRRDIREHIERAHRRNAGDAGNGAKPR